LWTSEWRQVVAQIKRIDTRFRFRQKLHPHFDFLLRNPLQTFNCENRLRGWRAPHFLHISSFYEVELCLKTPGAPITKGSLFMTAECSEESRITFLGCFFGLFFAASFAVLELKKFWVAFVMAEAMNLN